MLVTKLKMQSSPYGESVISAQTEHLNIKGDQQKNKRNLVKFFAFNSLLLLNAKNHLFILSFFNRVTHRLNLGFNCSSQFCECIQIELCAEPR